MKIKRSKITVITPIYNNKEDIINAIQSVENQTYKNWEYLIVDDCSTDGGFELIKEYLLNLNSNKISLLHNKKNMGTYISINKAIQKSSGDYITLLGSDDRFHLEKLEKQVKILDENPNILVTDAWYQRENLLSKNNCATLMFRRSIIKDIGYFDSLRFGADSEFKQRIMKYYKKRAFLKIPEILYFARRRPNSLTRSRITGRKNFRIDYKNRFTKWHKETKSLYIPFPLKKRPYEVDPIMLP